MIGENICKRIQQSVLSWRKVELLVSRGHLAISGPAVIMAVIMAAGRAGV